jgi:hypothetical protein
LRSKIQRVPQAAVIVGFGTMAMALHCSAMSIAVPAMIQQSQLTMVSEWVIAIYTLVLSTCLITSGRIGDAMELGTGLFVTPNTAELMASAQANRRVTITRIVATCRNIGMTTGVMVAEFAYSQVARPQGQKTGFRAAMFVLGAFAVLNLIYIAKVRSEALFNEVAKMSCGPSIVPVKVSVSDTPLYSSGETT